MFCFACLRVLYTGIVSVCFVPGTYTIKVKLEISISKLRYFGRYFGYSSISKLSTRSDPTRFFNDSSSLIRWTGPRVRAVYARWVERAVVLWTTTTTHKIFKLRTRDRCIHIQHSVCALNLYGFVVRSATKLLPSCSNNKF